MLANRRRQGGGGATDDYRKKLMRRAATLGQVTLAADGDLALSDGRSLLELSEEEQAQLGSIQFERLEGLNWLRGQEENWDMITADTIVNWLWDKEWPDETDANREPAPPKP